MKKKLLAVAFLAIFGLAGLAGLVMPEAALAETVQGKWINKGRIEIGGVPYIDSKPDDDSRDYYENGFTSNADCKKVIRDFEGNDRAKLHKRKRLPTFGGIDCVTDSKDDVELTDQESADDAGDGDGESDDDSCETRLKSPLSWIVCPIIEAALGATEQFDNAITSELTIKTDQLFNEKEKPGEKYYQIWSAMRFISMGFLVIIALVMVVSQAMSIGIFDAYTVRKVLPRLIAAVVFASLSWEIGIMLIEIANAFGHGIRAIIYAPFNDVTNLDNPFTIGSGGLSVTALLLAFHFMGALALLSLALSALMAAAIGFMVVVFRKIVIILLLLMAPFAIVCAILPNTEKVWKLWWDSFGKGLMMFPIIMAFIAVGRVVAAATQMTPDGSAGGSLLQQLITFIAYFGPYFALPATFRLAGGALATIGGLSNDRSRGAFDRLKNFRKGEISKKWADSKTQNRYGAEHKLLNRASQLVTRPDAMLPGRFGSKGRSVLSTNMSSQANMGAKALQEAGLLDDSAGNEFIQHGTSLSKLNARVRELRNSGKSAEADSLGAYAQYAGRKDMMLGAMKLNASFGKLSDDSLKVLDDIYGDTPAENAAKQAAFGDLIFTSKGAGNYATYAARIKNNRVMTMSDAIRAQEQMEDERSRGVPITLSPEEDQWAGEARQNMAKAMMDAGPNVLSSIKPFTNKDRSGKSIYNTKDLTARAVADGIFVAKDPQEFQRSIENLAMSSSRGSYNDPNMKAALDRAVAEIERRSTVTNPNDLSSLEGARIPVKISRPRTDPNGKVVGVEEVTQDMNPHEYYRYLSSQMRGVTDPRLVGLQDE